MRTPQTTRDPRSARARRAFSLLELIIVIAIIGMLAALVLPNLFSVSEKAKVQTTKTQIETLTTAVEDFRNAQARYPSEEEGLQALVERPDSIEKENWQGPYLGKETLPADGWNNPFIYKMDPKFGFRIISYGADGKEGGDGYNADIDNRS